MTFPLHFHLSSTTNRSRCARNSTPRQIPSTSHNDTAPTPPCLFFWWNGPAVLGGKCQLPVPLHIVACFASGAVLSFIRRSKCTSSPSACSASGVGLICEEERFHSKVHCTAFFSACCTGDIGFSCQKIICLSQEEKG